METSLKTGFAQIFSRCPKNLSCPNFGGGCSPLAPPARTPMNIVFIKQFYNSQKIRLIKFNSASVLHIPIEHADHVNKLFVIPQVVVTLAILLNLLSVSIITQQYTIKRLPCVFYRKFKRKRLRIQNCRPFSVLKTLIGSRAEKFRKCHKT